MLLKRKGVIGNAELHRKSEIRNQKLENKAASFQFLVSGFSMKAASGVGLTLPRARQILTLVGLRITGRK
jgi:hypothetical protein